MTPDLTDNDKAIIVDLLRETIERDRFPLPPKVKRLKAVLAKLDPPRPPIEPLPPPKPPLSMRSRASAIQPLRLRLMLGRPRTAS